ncbi:hypothetical protein RF11_13455 [Thelohanellus kitauei]|uniref:Uncharacterized protein n=1 Tax=Thelohanellus kitauei TaxID=669202 RepID=A0A0C2J5T2_THEKT|nr:hypothetical protein RF11_13455 [Thelohanellus kitauei]
MVSPARFRVLGDVINYINHNIKCGKSRLCTSESDIMDYLTEFYRNFPSTPPDPDVPPATIFLLIYFALLLVSGIICLVVFTILYCIVRKMRRAPNAHEPAPEFDQKGYGEGYEVLPNQAPSVYYGNDKRVFAEDVESSEAKVLKDAQCPEYVV